MSKQACDHHHARACANAIHPADNGLPLTREDIRMLCAAYIERDDWRDAALEYDDAEVASLRTQLAQAERERDEYERGQDEARLAAEAERADFEQAYGGPWNPDPFPWEGDDA